MNDIGNYGRVTMVVGSGNEGAAGGHRILKLSEEREAELSVAPNQVSFSVQIWKSYTDQFQVQIQTPSGERLGPITELIGSSRYRYGNTWILIYYGEPGPYSVEQEIYLDFVPDTGAYVESGIWQFQFLPRKIVTGRVDLWLPASGILNPSTRFFSSSPDTTLTIPSTAKNVITVGAYNGGMGTYADFSGRGFTRVTDQVKPDLVAPGVDIQAPAVGGGFGAFTGTSFAAPIVSGSAALLMQWGITDGNDLFLYGEKVKAYLRRGARAMPEFEEYPNPQVGYGYLCVKQSIPEK